MSRKGAKYAKEKPYHCLLENIEQMQKEIAGWLGQTQGAFLTSLRGIGVVLAAGITKQIGVQMTRSLYEEVKAEKHPFSYNAH